MRTVGDAGFFRTFDALFASLNPPATARRPRWTHDGVTWTVERHTHQGASCSFAIVVCALERGGCGGWRMLVARQHWWTEGRDEPIRDVRWAKLLRGGRADALGWFRRQEATLHSTRSRRDVED